MIEFLSSRTAEIVIGLALMAAVIAVGIYLIQKVREWRDQKEPPPSTLITKFREIHSQGGLSDEEYRTIKAVLTQQLHEELKDNGETG
jgi:uncharacterized membrane protein